MKVVACKQAVHSVCHKHRTPPWAVDHSARGSMKNAAKCASSCKLQDTNIDISNAHCGLGEIPWLHLSEGLLRKTLNAFFCFLTKKVLHWEFDVSCHGYNVVSLSSYFFTERIDWTACLAFIQTASWSQVLLDCCLSSCWVSSALR